MSNSVKASLQIKKLSHIKPKDKKYLFKLLKLGQEKLVDRWLNIPKTHQSILLQQIDNLEKNYPGGIYAYQKTTKLLLDNLEKDALNFDSKDIMPAPNIDLRNITSDQYRRYEKIGWQHSKELTFVLVAGGLGERLGYPKAKPLIPFSLIAGSSYLEHYITLIRHLNKHNHNQKDNHSKPINLIIMTSSATHQSISDFLIKHAYFGMQKEEILLLKQNAVPSFENSLCHLATVEEESTQHSSKHCKLLLKPHGHGEIHWLMYQHKVSSMLLKQGKKYLFFIQDTNAQIVNITLSSLGAVIDKKLSFAYVGVKRTKNEKTGLLVQIKNRQTVNIEYNLLEYLFQNKDFPHTESSFLGNTNLLLADIDTYHKVINQTKGLVPKFINPKYRDKAKKYFDKPVRLESMMQDYVYLLPKKASTCVLAYENSFAFSPAKNNLSTAIAALEQGSNPQGIFSAEWDFYHNNFMLLKKIGVLKSNYRFHEQIEKNPPYLLKKIADNKMLTFLSPKIILSPRLLLQCNALNKKIKNLVLEPHTTLLIDAEVDNIDITDLTLKKFSALIIKLGEQVSLIIKKTVIQNKGFSIMMEKSMPDSTAIKNRGYTFINQGALVIEINQAGSYELIDEKIVPAGNN